MSERCVMSWPTTWDGRCADPVTEREMCSAHVEMERRRLAREADFKARQERQAERNRQRAVRCERFSIELADGTSAPCTMYAGHRGDCAFNVLAGGTVVAYRDRTGGHLLLAQSFDAEGTFYVGFRKS